MPRRTKEEAQQTRSSILDAAEHVFDARGVAATTLHDIAQAAGVTRGAVYWHFKDKADLFNAMLDRVCLPFESSTESLAHAVGSESLKQLREHFERVLQRIAQDLQMRRVFSIAMQKVESNDELARVRERRLRMRSDYLEQLAEVLQAARRSGLVRARPSPRQMAIGVHALLDGLAQNWLLDPSAFDLRRVGLTVLDLYLDGLKAKPRAAQP